MAPKIASRDSRTSRSPRRESRDGRTSRARRRSVNTGSPEHFYLGTTQSGENTSRHRGRKSSEYGREGYRTARALTTHYHKHTSDEYTSPPLR
jgi:hypothetical protein